MTQADRTTDLGPPRAYKLGQTRMALFFVLPPPIKPFHARLSTSPQYILTIHQMAPITKGNRNIPEKNTGSSQEETTRSTSPIRPKRKFELASIIPSNSLCCAFTISAETSLCPTTYRIDCCQNATAYLNVFNCPWRALFSLTLNDHLARFDNPAIS